MAKLVIPLELENNLTLTAVSLKDPNHYESQKELYEYVFSKYKNYEIINKDNFSIDQEYYHDKLYIKESFYYPLTENELTKIKTLVKITKLKNYNNNDKVGEIVIKFNGSTIKKINIYVKKEKKKNSFFSSLFKR